MFCSSQDLFPFFAVGEMKNPQLIAAPRADHSSTMTPQHTRTQYTRTHTSRHGQGGWTLTSRSSSYLV